MHRAGHFDTVFRNILKHRYFETKRADLYKISLILTKFIVMVLQKVWNSEFLRVS